MDYDFDHDCDSLRVHLRRLIANQVPIGFLGAFTDDPEDLDITNRFCKLLASEGLLARAWPKSFGGGGGSVWEQTVVREEMWAYHEPRGPQYMGLNWVGPAIMRFGTAEQQRSHLPPIANGDVIWCQGFSEPEAGSDLASLRTRAKPTTSGWQITGQKVWTSYATMAQWCVIAARTSAEARRQDGITVFLLPMDRPGISVRPIASMLGPHHLNEIFLDEVPVGTSDVLGEVGDGWTVMREALAYERVGIARYARCERLLSELPRHLGGTETFTNPGLENRWLQALLAARTARLLAYRAVHEQSRGVVNDMTASAARIVATTTDQFVADVLADALGPRILASEGANDDWFRAEVEDHWRYSQAATVASGTLEIQLMLVARSVLGHQES